MSFQSPLKLFIWPERPAAFDSSGFALLLSELPKNLPRRAARLFSRQILREVIVQLFNTSELTETPQGPVCPAGHLSISYADNKLLIGLSRVDKLGVDITATQPPPEAEALSRLYLPASSTSFALAWARMEAGSKALGHSLTEISDERSCQLARCRFIPCEQIDGYHIAVATVSTDHLCKQDD